MLADDGACVADHHSCVPNGVAMRSVPVILRICFVHGVCVHACVADHHSCVSNGVAMRSVPEMLHISFVHMVLFAYMLVRACVCMCV